MPSDRRHRAWWFATVAILVMGVAARAGVVAWSRPWTPHHPDEHILPLEALALWEGITPREVGWPAATSRLALSAVEGAELIATKHAALWRAKSRPAELLDVVASWIGAQFVEPSSLYKTGRLVSVVAGIVQLMLLIWVLGQWVGPIGVAAGTFAVALSPLPVLYSQYVLSDVMGLLFATAVVGLAAKPSGGRLVSMAVLAGLAAASKFHFGLWLLTPLFFVYQLESTPRRRLLMAMAIVGMAGWVIITLVPWFWVNPLLALKEFLGVVVVKMSGGSIGSRVPRNALALFNSVGVLASVGVVASFYFFDRRDWRRMFPVAVPALVGFLILVTSPFVFDRYGLVLIPGAVLVGALGWERWLTVTSESLRRVALVAFAGCIVFTGVSLWNAERVAAEADVDVLVRDWVLDHVRAGSRVAVHDEMNARLPRTVSQLEDCAAAVATPTSYRRKWAVEGVDAGAISDEPMRSMVLNDEQFEAYWCRRELAVASGPAFVVVRYHDAPRFDAVLESNALREFASGGTADTGGIDVLVANREVEVGNTPVVTFSTARGRRVIYQK